MFSAGTLAQFAPVRPARYIPFVELVLTGRISRDPETGQWVSHCNELDVGTWGPTFEDVIQDTIAMLRDHFAEARRLGLLASEFKRAGFAPPDGDAPLRARCRLPLPSGDVIELPI